MAKQFENHIFSGMQRDVGVSKHPAQFIYDSLNVRLTAREGDTLLSITNEKGTADTEMTVEGKYLGHCVLSKYLVVFSTDAGHNNDYIYRIDLSRDKDSGASNPNPRCLYNSNKGSLGFSDSHPIDAIASYESEAIQKVYWTDGVNQPRMINIAPSNDSRTSHYNSHSFDFIPELRLQETVSVQKLFGASGMFAPGMIQYAFTYYDKYGHETNIFYTTKLYAVAYRDRGASPEDKVDVAFKIVIHDLDRNFNYLRIYSIQRTSINGTPICKRVQDIKVSETNYDSEDDEYWTVFIDNGTIGGSVEPTELLYKGGESIIAQTIEQKDSTLFLGNLSIKRDSVSELKVRETYTLKSKIEYDFASNVIDVDIDSSNDNARLESSYRSFRGEIISTGDIPYTNTIDHSGLKANEVYRFGMQFQHKSGKWSEPVWLRDYKIKTTPSINEETGAVKLPQVKVTLSDTDILTALSGADYKKARLMMAQPSNTDRTILCQGIANPVVYSDSKRHGMDVNGTPYHAGNKGPLYAQSSWLFRPYYENTPYGDTTATDGGGYISAYHKRSISDFSNLYGVTGATGNFSSPELRSTEIGASLRWGEEFKVDNSMVTIHTPELIFDESLFAEDWGNAGIKHIGNALFSVDYGDIDIQTKTPTIGSAQGFIHKPIKTDGNAALIAGLFYEDYIVDDYDDGNPKYNRYPNMHVPVSWPVFMWHKNGSLNNDVQRDARSAELLKKKISNYHVSNSTTPMDSATDIPNSGIQLFQNDEVSVIKVDGHPYMGNIDTSLIPGEAQPKYFVGNPWRTSKDTTFLTNVTMCLRLKDPGDENTRNGFWIQSFPSALTIEWTNYAGDWKHIGDLVPDLCETSEPIRMKYKSTPHLVALLSNDSMFGTTSHLPLVEVTKPYNKDTFFGGQSDDALKANIWIPISDPVNITSGSFTITSNRGDTWYQRFDCLKTYAFTPEDINQVVDIASFMVETHLNIDGRYDRNRGQTSNLNMSPRNYNLYNPVYSQADNFFNYRILDSDYYKNRDFPNQITWTKEKQSGADIDLWTNITLASTYDMDGSKGKVVSLNTWKDQIYCFQNKGVSNILFNSRVQIPVSDGVPIEITNNYKVDGYKYLSDGIGCNSRWLIKETSSGIYFIDSVGSHLLHIGDTLQDLTEKCNMTTWFKTNSGTIKKVVFDDINHDVYMVQDIGGKALCFSEKLGQFTGFYDYDDISLVETYKGHVFTMKDENIYKMFEGNYGDFFGKNKPWSLTFINNGSSNNTTTLDKTFTNLEFRACVEGDGKIETKEVDGEQVETGKFIPYLPFDTLETWNEYQHGIANLKNLSGHKSMMHHSGTDASLKRKFRIWRCDIPRDNATVDPEKEALLGISRFRPHPLDRMRNPWIYLKLTKLNNTNKRTEVHDLVITYYS